MVVFSQNEQALKEYIRQNNIEAAVKLLYELILKSAKEKKFSKAEALRQRLLEIDPMALNEIIGSAEMIEEEKSKSIERSHLKIWPELYNLFTDEEKNVLYYALEETTYSNDQPLFMQGELNTNLYFINQGELKMIYKKEGLETLLKIIRPGQIVGEDTFFSHTICTCSVITLSKVNLNYLQKDILIKWKDKFPGIEPKLKDYCLGKKNVHELLKEKNLDRRSHNRVKISSKGFIQLLNRSGESLGKAFKGSITDISVGGLSFDIKISKEKTARLLLGRNLHIKFNLPDGIHPNQIDQNGVVIGIHAYPFKDHSIHVKFEKMLSPKLIEEIEIKIQQSGFLTP